MPVTVHPAPANGTSATSVQEDAIWPERGYDALIPRQLATNTAVSMGTDASRNFYFGTFTAPADMVCDGVHVACGGTAALGATYFRLALYHVGVSNSGEPSFLPLARTASDTTLLTATNTRYERSWDTASGWPGSVRLVRGQRYAIGWQHNATTNPTGIGGTYMRGQVIETAVSPFVAGRSAGMGALTDLPDYIPFASLGVEGAAGVVWWNLTLDPASTQARPLRAALTGDSYFASYAGWFGYGNAQAASPLLPVLNDGIGGQQASQVLARIDDTLAVSPDIVVLHVGCNDIAATVPAATVQSNIEGIISAVLAAGADIVVATIPPTSGMDAAELVELEAVNTWLLGLSQAGVHVADTGRALSTGDGVTRDAALFTDGAHPNAAGRQAMANVLDDVLGAL